MNTLRQAVGEYLEMRHGLGFKLQEAGKGLIDFITFLEQHSASYITQELALVWAQQPSNVQPAHSAKRLSFVREFARYRSATDPRTQVPLQGLLPFKPKRARPYLYSDEEIRSLLHAALNMHCRFERGKLRPWVYYCLFGLLSVSGLRLGEARNLELQDVDLEAAVLTIRGAKFGKTRLVPLHASTCTVLGDYIARRQRHWAGRVVSSYLFVSNWGNRLDKGEIHRTFYALSRQIGLRGMSAVEVLVCTTCAIDLRQIPSCNGIGPVRIPKGDCLYCPPTLVMYTSPIRSGIWRALPSSCARRCNGCRSGGRIGHEDSHQSGGTAGAFLYSAPDATAPG